MEKSLKARVLVIAMSALGVAACSEPPAPDATGDTARPVKIIEVMAASANRQSSYPAVIGANRSSELSFSVGGVISELPAVDAQDVKQGDLIARLDPRDFESQLSSAQASFKNADDEYQRAVRLSSQDAIAQSAVEQRKTQRDVAKNELDSATKALEDSVLRAPYNGVIANVPVRSLQTVSPGTVIANLLDLSLLEATINLPASVVAQVPTQEDRRSAVILEAAPGREIEATFKEANLLADATSQTYSVTFTFLPPQDLLVLPGMNATMVLRSQGANAGAAAAVPLAAVQSDGQGQFVWVVNQDTMAVARRAITVAQGIGETLTIVDGLTAGEQIVGAGGAYLTAGAQVTPWTE